jgi:hypothetical protein
MMLTLFRGVVLLLVVHVSMSDDDFKTRRSSSVSSTSLPTPRKHRHDIRRILGGKTNPTTPSSTTTTMFPLGATTTTTLPHIGSLNHVVGGIQGEANILFGSSIALNAAGTIMAVGAVQDGSGQVFVFSLQSQKWSNIATIIGRHASDVFGASLALSADGTLLAIGATPPHSSGYVELYRILVSTTNNPHNDNNNFIFLASVKSGLPAGRDAFGASVALSSNGNVLAVGAPETYLAGGRVEVFRFNGTSFSSYGAPFIGSYNSTYRLGQSVSLSSNGNILAVGEPGYTNVALGRVRIFTINNHNNNEWNQLGNALYGTLVGDRLGQTVSLSANGQRVAVTLVSTSRGSSTTRVYQYSPKLSQWQALGAGATDAIRVFPKVVSLSADGTIVATGSLFTNDLPTATSSSASVYQVSNNGTWDQIGSSVKPGAVVSLSGNAKTLAVSFISGTVATVRTFQVVL